MKWLQMFNSVQWKLIVIYVSLILIAMQLVGVYFFRELEDYYVKDFQRQLRSQANLLEDALTHILTEKDQPTTMADKKEMDRLLQQLFILNKSQVTIQAIDKDGIVTSTTSANKQVEQQRNIRANNALQGLAEDYIRIDPMTGNRIQVLSIPIKVEGEVAGALYIEASMEETYDTIGNITKILIKITLVTLFLTVILMVIVARTITNPIKQITKQATAMADGNFDQQVDVKSDDEIGRLSTAFNHLAEHLRRALSQNEEEKEKLESVLANMSDGVLATDPEGHVIVVNKRAEEILNKSIPIGEAVEHLLPIPDSINFPLLKMRRILLELVSDDGERNLIKVTLTPIKRHDEEMVALIAVLQDVTEEEKLDRERKEFVANVSHELRTPLTTIKSYLESLEDGAIHQPDIASRFIKVARQEADRMTRLIHDLLQLSRFDAKQVAINKQPTELNKILTSAADRFSMQCKKKEITLSLQMPNKSPMVLVDGDRIDQLMDNLLSNAVKYTPEGGSILISCFERPDDMVDVAISDTGIGIPKKDLERIFERFYRVDKARSRELGGTGLGLSIVQEIIQAHDGTVRIESTLNQGTTVTFSLPVYETGVVG
mgnify:CR=1 FL=1